MREIRHGERALSAAAPALTILRRNIAWRIRAFRRIFRHPLQAPLPIACFAQIKGMNFTVPIKLLSALRGSGELSKRSLNSSCIQSITELMEQPLQ
jgi:hypothetical protein